MVQNQLKKLLSINKKAQKLRDKRLSAYVKHKDYSTDMSYENEIDRQFLDDLANNSPNESQFKEKNLDKKS
jgi:hypothetical protein